MHRYTGAKGGTAKLPSFASAPDEHRPKRGWLGRCLGMSLNRLHCFLPCGLSGPHEPTHWGCGWFSPQADWWCRKGDGNHPCQTYFCPHASPCAPHRHDGGRLEESLHARFCKASPGLTPSGSRWHRRITTTSQCMCDSAGVSAPQVVHDLPLVSLVLIPPTLIPPRMAATMNALRVKAPVAAARLSSRNNTACSPVLPKAASAPGMTRLVSLVCEAQQGSKSAAAKAMQAVRCVSLYAVPFCACTGRLARDKCTEDERRRSWAIPRRAHRKGLRGATGDTEPGRSFVHQLRSPGSASSGAARGGASSDRVRSSAVWAAQRALETRQTARDEVYGISVGGLQGRTALSRLWGGVCRRIGRGPRSKPCRNGRPATQRRGVTVELGDAPGRIIPSGVLPWGGHLPASTTRFLRGSVEP